MSGDVSTSSASEIPADASKADSSKTDSGSRREACPTTDESGAGCLVELTEDPKKRWFSVAGHLHLGLGLKLGKVYSEEDLRSRCLGHQEKLGKLKQCLADSSLLKEVSAPATKARRDEIAAGKKRGHSATRASSEHESRAARKRYRDSRHFFAVGQVVWHSAIQPPRPARLTAIAAEREDMYLIRYIDSNSEGSNTSFKLGDVVNVRGRKGELTWDGRPEHQFAKVRWENGTESDVMPLSEVRAQDKLDEDLFVRPEELQSLPVSQLMQVLPNSTNPSAGSARPAVVRPVSSVTTDQSLLREGSVAWVFGESRAPWPVQLQSLISSEAEPQVWRVRHLGTGDADNEEVPASQLISFRSGDARALAAVAEDVELAHATQAAKQAASRRDE